MYVVTVVRKLSSVIHTHTSSSLLSQYDVDCVMCLLSLSVPTTNISVSLKNSSVLLAIYFYYV